VSSSSPLERAKYLARIWLGPKATVRVWSEALDDQTIWVASALDGRRSMRIEVSAAPGKRATIAALVDDLREKIRGLRCEVCGSRLRRVID